MDTSSPLPAHFQSTSGSLPVHLGTIGGHMRHHSYSLPKKKWISQNLWTDIRTDRWTLSVHFRPTSSPFPVTSSPLPVHFRSIKGTIGGHMRHHSYSLPKKKNFAKFADGHTEKKWLLKIPFAKRSGSKKEILLIEPCFYFHCRNTYREKNSKGGLEKFVDEFYKGTTPKNRPNMYGFEAWCDERLSFVI